MSETPNDQGRAEGEPSPPPIAPGDLSRASDGGSTTIEGYHTVAETVGFLPSLRGKDNLIQFGAAAVGTFVGAGIGGGLVALDRSATLPWWVGALIGGVIGLIASVLVSGFVLMVLGWIRAAGKAGRKTKH